MFRRLLYIVTVLLVVCACDKDDDEYEYSMLTAEICNIETSSKCSVSGAYTDNDTYIPFVTPMTVSWATKSDSTYRALIYYNKVEGSNQVKPVRADYVACLYPKSKAEAKEWGDDADPVELVSVWMAANGKYLNFCVGFKCGSTTDDSQKHSIGMVCDSIVQNHRYYRLAHSQNGVPAYYTIDSYMSMPLENIPSGDTLTLSVPTWNGTVQKDYIKK